MQLTWNGTNLHDIGIVSLMGESAEYEPAEGAMTMMVKLDFRIDVWRTSFTDNRVKLQEVQAALLVQNATLNCVQEALPGGNTITLYNQMARIVASNFPQDINEWGTTHQQLRVTFALARNDLTANNIPCTFTPEGGDALALGNVFGWKEGMRVARYDEKRDHRQHAEGSVSVRGMFRGDMTQTLEDRRAALFTLKEAWQDAMTSKRGLLEYQSFSENVRVTELTIDVDEALEKLVWAFSAIYTRFPNEDGYAGADYEISTRDNSDDGEQFLTLSGKIIAEDEDRAQAKLITIRSGVLADNGFIGSKITTTDIKVRRVSMSSFEGVTDVGDGETFIELTFGEEYKKKNPDHLSWTLSIDDQNEIERGLVTRTYSGSVACGFNEDGAGDGVESSTTYQYARWLAILKAKELGDGKHSYQVRSSLKFDDRLLNKTSFREFVKCDFSFTYQVRSNRIHAEVKTDTQQTTFGEDTQTISGFIVGASQEDLNTLYDTIKAETVDGSSLVRNESKSFSESRVQDGSYPNPAAATGDIETLADNWAFTPTGSSYSTILYRLDFSFQVWQDKEAGTYGIKYTMKVEKDLLRLMKTTTIQGSLFGTESIVQDALDYADLNKLDVLLEYLDIGTSLKSDRSVDREYANTLGTSAGKNIKLDFSEVYEQRMTGDDTILEAEISEDLTFSGDRNVVIGVPDRTVVVQAVGKTEGRRTISGSVTAANETVCLKWIKRQQITPFADADVLTGIPAAPDTDARYAEPVKIQLTNVFPKLTDGTIRGDEGQAPNLVRASFSFTEIIPDYEYQ